MDEAGQGEETLLTSLAVASAFTNHASIILPSLFNSSMFMLQPNGP